MPRNLQTKKFKQPYLTPAQIVNLANECVKNYLKRNNVDLALKKLNILPGRIEQSDHLPTYYINVIEYLVGRGKLKPWLKILKEYPFTQKWIKRL